MSNITTFILFELFVTPAPTGGSPPVRLALDAVLARFAGETPVVQHGRLQELPCLPHQRSPSEVSLALVGGIRLRPHGALARQKYAQFTGEMWHT